MNSKYTSNLEKRLIDFSILIIKYTRDSKTNDFATQHVHKQIISSATAAALNYAEARSAESQRDFIHKLKIALKELRETYVNLKIQTGINSDIIDTKKNV